MKKGLTVYLAGGMEAAKNLGAGWRSELTPFLVSLGLTVLDPTVFEPEQLKGLQPKRLPEYCTDLDKRKIKVNYWHDLKNASEPNLFTRFQKYMRRVIKYDIGLVRKEVDYMIVFWDETAARGAGTHAEMTEAFLCNLPVYCVATTDMPAWLKGTCSKIFLNFEVLKEFLTEEFGD